MLFHLEYSKGSHVVHGEFTKYISLPRKYLSLFGLLVLLYCVWRAQNWAAFQHPLVLVRAEVGVERAGLGLVSC